MTGGAGNLMPLERIALARALVERDRAWLRLTALRRAALLGVYDADEFDRAVLAHWRAARAVEGATVAMLAECAPCPVAPGPPEPGLAGQGPGQGPGQAIVPDIFLSAFPAPVGRMPALPPARSGTARAFVPTARMRFAKWLVTTGRVSDEGSPREIDQASTTNTGI
jgi:hypothetical protein